jgi:hypothetical protein
MATLGDLRQSGSRELWEAFPPAHQGMQPDREIRCSILLAETIRKVRSLYGPYTDNEFKEWPDNWPLGAEAEKTYAEFVALQEKIWSDFYTWKVENQLNAAT